MTAALKTTVAADPPITALAIHPSGTQLVLGSQSGLQRIVADQDQALLAAGTADVNISHNAQRLSTGLEHIHDVQFSPDGTLLAVAGGTPGQFGQVEVLSSTTASLLTTLSDHNDVVMSIAWSADGSLLATTGLDAVMQVYQVTHSTASVSTAPIEPSEAIVTLEKLYRATPHAQPIVAVTAWRSESGSTLITAALDATIQVCRPTSSKLDVVRTLNNHTAPLTALATTTADDMRDVLVSSSEDRTVRFWHPESGRLLRFVRLRTTPLCLGTIRGRSTIVVGDDHGDLHWVNSGTAQIEKSQPSGVARTISLVVDPRQSRLFVGGPNGHLRRVAIE